MVLRSLEGSCCLSRAHLRVQHGRLMRRSRPRDPQCGKRSSLPLPRRHRQPQHAARVLWSHCCLDDSAPSEPVPCEHKRASITAGTHHLSACRASPFAFHARVSIHVLCLLHRSEHLSVPDHLSLLAFHERVGEQRVHWRPPARLCDIQSLCGELDRRGNRGRFPLRRSKNRVCR